MLVYGLSLKNSSQSHIICLKSARQVTLWNGIWDIFTVDLTLQLVYFYPCSRWQYHCNPRATGHKFAYDNCHFPDGRLCSSQKIFANMLDIFSLSMRQSDSYGHRIKDKT